MNPRVNLLNLSKTQLVAFFSNLGEDTRRAGMRAKQLLHWVHQKGIDDFAAMTDFTKPLREQLAQQAYCATAAVTHRHVSADGTRKWLMDVGQGNAIETVFIPESTRGTLCISTQAGCAVNCRFCSTGKQGFNRNLTLAEIIGQLWMAEFALRKEAAADRFDAHPLNPPDHIASEFLSQRQITNVVMMGMGEPLLNFEPTVAALQLMLDDHAYGLSRRRVTLSTSGVVPMIDRLAQECPVALAVSLHAPNDRLRDQLVPLNKKYPLAELIAACQRYLAFAPRDFITFEYCMLDGVNDSVAHALELLKLVEGLPCKFNLIPFNPFPASGLSRSSDLQIKKFAQVLLDHDQVTTVRKTRGDDIDAACGQLAGEVQDRTQVVRRMQTMQEYSSRFPQSLEITA